MNKKTIITIISILFLVAALMVLLLAGSYLYKMYFAAGGWRTYVSQKYGYEFRYPTYLKIISTDPRRVDIANESASPLFAANIQVDDSKAADNKTTLQSYVEWLTMSSKSAEIKDTILDGVNAKIISQESSSVDSLSNVTDLVVLKNGNVYILEVLNKGINGEQYDASDFAKIVSSFKFK